MIRDLSFIDVMYLGWAARWTVGLTLLALVGGSPIALLIAICANGRSRLLSLPARAYISIVQGVPLLGWLFLTFFGFSILGLNVPALIAAAIAFSLYASAFLGEIWFGALASVPRGQWEAATAIGLSGTQQMRYVIVPQAVRIALPPTIGFVVQLVKNTSLASVIGFVELTREGQLTAASTLSQLPVYLLVGLLYFLICYPMTKLSRILERSLHANS
ncbi:MAG: amino acid ABC transporter permease [Rhizobiaceae bacterium]|nr:amino acid ABC transporter permease [Rhizobiaceae bacterium]